jgi:hypothetical protein
MKFTCAVLAAALWVAPCAFAQKLDLNFDALADRAAEKSEIDLDFDLLRLFLHMGGESDRDGILSGVRALRVRSYTFEKPGEYSAMDLESLRARVGTDSRWARIVIQKEGESTAEVWVAADGDKLGACLVVAAEPRELSVVYLEGTMSLAQIKGLMDHDGWHGVVRLAGGKNRWHADPVKARTSERR